MADISKIKPLGSNTTYNIKDNSAIASITRSGTTFTATRRDGTTFTFNQQDNNTWNSLSTSQAGYVAKAPNDTNKFLRGDATWAKVTWDNIDGKPTNFSPSTHTHATSLDTDTGTSQITLAYGEKYKLTTGGTSIIFTMPSTDDTDTHWTTHLYLGNSTIGTGHVSSDITNGNVYLRLYDETTARENIKIIGAGATSVTGKNGVITISSTDTNTKVTSVDNHYTPTPNTNSALSVSASGATAAWDIDVVKAVQLQRDAKGHVTGISVTSGKLPSNPNTDYKVRQTNDNTDAEYRLLLSYSANDTEEDNISRKNTNLRYNPSINKLSTGNLDLTGNLQVSGNATLNNNTSIENAIINSLLVNGNSNFINNVNFIQIPTAPTAAAGTNTTQIATTEFVTNAVAQGFIANDAMVFKGLIGSNQPITQLPTSGYNAGWTYRVADAGIFAGEYCEVGDLLIAINDGPASGSSVINADWGKVEHNIDGAVFRGSGASNSSVGSSTQPVYVNGSGIITAITGAIANDTTGNAATATTASKLSNTSAIGSSTQPVYFNSSGQPVAVNKYDQQTGKTTDFVPYVKSDGVMEIGKYIDFHNTSEDTSGYIVRITARDSSETGGAGLTLTGTTVGTFKGNLNGNAATATTLATGRTLKVNLASTSASTAFNGAANITDIGVSGILPVAQGGTGQDNIDNFVKVYSRSDMGNSINYDNPGVNGLFEARKSSEITATGEWPGGMENWFPLLSLKTSSVIMQIAGNYGYGWWIRGRQGANATLTGVAWERLVTNSGTWGINITGNATTATTASKLSNTSKIGDTNKPVYFKADGTPAAINYTIDKSVPSNAVFTDRYVNSATFADDSTNTAASPVKMTLTRAGSDTVTVTANIPKVSSSSAGVVPKGTTVSSQSQSTKFLREDGTWAAPSYTVNTNTDTLVKQTSKSDNKNYKILFTTSDSPTSGNANEAAYDTGITINPSTHTLTATGFVGNLTGTASKATADANGNNIINTYLPLTGGTMTGNLQWNDLTALPNTTTTDYFLAIDSFANGGTTKHITKANAIKSLISSSAIGTSLRPVYWTGSSFSQVNWFPSYCKVDGHNRNNYNYHRIATLSIGGSTWVDKDAVLVIRSQYNASNYGIVKISGRTNNNQGLLDLFACWLIRSGFKEDSILICRKRETTDTSLGDTQVDVYLRTPNSYPRICVYMLVGPSHLNGFQLINSEEKDNSVLSYNASDAENPNVIDINNSDLKGSYEVYIRDKDENGNLLNSFSGYNPNNSNSQTTPTAQSQVYTHIKTALDAGSVSRAKKSSLISTNQNAIVYYTDTTGTFGQKASANGVLYATSANGSLQWGTLPMAQGGTGATTAAGARTNLGLGTMATEAANNYIAKSIGTAKGDIIYWSAANTPARLNIGSVGQVLKVSSNGIPVWSNVNITPANILGSSSTAKFWRGDNTWSNLIRDAHSKSLSTFVAIAGSDNAWNKAGNYNFAISNSNNMMVFNIGGTSDDRNAYIQVGHNNPDPYGNITGNLYLNKLGGQVYINENYAAQVTSVTSGQVMVADGTTGGIKTTGYTIATSVPSSAVFTDYRVKQDNTTTSNWRKILLHCKDDATSTAGVTNSTNQVFAAVGVSVQPSTGAIRATKYNIADHVSLEYNSTLETLNFVFS